MHIHACNCSSNQDNTTCVSPVGRMFRRKIRQIPYNLFLPAITFASFVLSQFGIEARLRNKLFTFFHR